MPEPLDDCREERRDETRAEKKAWRTPLLITRRLDETASPKQTGLAEGLPEPFFGPAS